MTDSGFPMHQVTVGKIENAARPTSVGEVSALAQIFSTQAPNLLRQPRDEPKPQALGLSMGEVRRLYGEISTIEAQVYDLTRRYTKLWQEYVEAVDWYRTAKRR
jgi:hypothetical protein